MAPFVNSITASNNKELMEKIKLTDDVFHYLEYIYERKYCKICNLSFGYIFGGTLGTNTEKYLSPTVLRKGVGSVSCNL